MHKRISRRDLLKALAVTAGSLTMCGDLSGAQGTASPRGVTETAEEEKRAFLPLISRTVPPPPDSRVVHVHAPAATFWSGQTGYWNYVDQDKVNEMVDHGLMRLTGTGAVADAWRALLPSYRVGQGIAIKVSFNNSTTCDDGDGQIDGLIQPINAMVRGMKQSGVAESDIWIYDAIRAIPERFVQGRLYPSMRFFDGHWSGYCREPAGWNSNDPDAYVSFDPPPAVPAPSPVKLPDVLIDATYMINMPIMKRHPLAGVSLSFKNHFGTINSPGSLHEYISPSGTYYREDYSPFVDIYQNPHIVGKTIVTIGDGLFAAKQFNQPPVSWGTFENQVPNSLFFATDPVAIDCIMCDLLDAEFGIPVEADDYLRLASQAGLGIFERGDPWGNGYQQIDYQRTDL